MKLLKILIVSTIALSALTTTASADVSKGQKLYLKKLKKACGINGGQMALKHTQEEWEDLKYKGKLENEIKRLCPKVKDVKDKYLDDLFDFLYEYGEGSGNVPSC